MGFLLSATDRAGFYTTVWRNEEPRSLRLSQPDSHVTGDEVVVARNVLYAYVFLWTWPSWLTLRSADRRPYVR
jgi:hypothetical protein